MRDDWTPERIGVLIERLGLSAAGLAGVIGCHQVTVEAWLRGERKPTGAAHRTLERLEAEWRERDKQACDEAVKSVQRMRTECREKEGAS